MVGLFVLKNRFRPQNWAISNVEALIGFTNPMWSPKRVTVFERPDVDVKICLWKFAEKNRTHKSRMQSE